MLEVQHHDHRHNQRQCVHHASRVEIRFLPLRRLARVHSLLAGVVRVEGQKERDEEPGNHHIAQSEHAEELARVFGGSGKLLREHELDGALHARGDLHHNLRAEHPEDVVDEEARLCVMRSE